VVQARISLVEVHPSILSAYQKGSGKVGGSRESLIPLVQIRRSGLMVEAAATNLMLMNMAVSVEGGDLRISDCYRSFDVQQQAHNFYLNWRAAGYPPRGTPEFDPKTMKDAYVAEPGHSFHNAGRAIDFDVARIALPNTPKDKQLDRFWDIATGFGFSPIIDKPNEHQKEAWHFDYLGPWKYLKDNYGYSMAAMAAVLDVEGAHSLYGRDPVRLLQAQLHRVGIDCGAIDGHWGPMTKKGLLKAGVMTPSNPVPELYALEDGFFENYKVPRW
jgi:D-alanyl-D-alanine dipeptidase